MKTGTNMIYDGIKYDFTPKELMYFLFAKKVCPRCGGGLIKKKWFEIAAGETLNEASDPVFAPNSKVKHYRYSYECLECGNIYTLRELCK